MIKVCATGNDFLVFDLLKHSRPLPQKAEIAQLCHRQQGFGADGFVVLKPHASHAFEWMFFNSDGGEAEMCGNAARAVAQYHAYSTQESSFSFLTRIGPIQAQVDSPTSLAGNVTVQMPLWKEYEENQSSPAGEFTYVNTGVPHAVLQVSDLKNLESLKDRALKIKALSRFAERGVNVTFKASTSETHKIQSVTFERGVENFTLSCGTGAIASAVSHAQGRQGFDVVVQVPGGVLSVSSDEKNVRLKGEGRIIGMCLLGVIDEPQS